ncbi:hypothetical protein CDG77_23270 [Nostoc sp. 'Peltigera membranacea cyanobiont' 213]|nr:hypothetical protein CDG77_23270 [Nostoc sp. 'Peltigera membranacea cyanobiont' 213]OYE02096.1 hypothetical protein CDG79_25700 [Nostoc sp. 'Peltigera membranacea cyanobiont' 232]
MSEDVDNWHFSKSDACFGLRLRISRLQNRENLENALSAVLKYLGELKRLYLTEVEEKVLGLIEKEYGIDDRFGFELNNVYDRNYL